MSRQFATTCDIFCPIPFLPSPFGFRRFSAYQRVAQNMKVPSCIVSKSVYFWSLRLYGGKNTHCAKPRCAPKVTQGSPAEPLSCKKIKILQFSEIISWYKFLRPWGQWHLYYTLQAAPISSPVALLQHRDLVGVGTRKHAPPTTNCEN